MIEQREAARGELEVGSPHWVIARTENFTGKIFERTERILEPGRRLDVFFLLISFAMVFLMGIFNDPIRDLIAGDGYLVGFFRVVRLVFWIACLTAVVRLCGARIDRRYQILLIISTMVAKWSTYLGDGIAANYVAELAFYAVTLAYLYGMQLWSQRRGNGQPSFVTFTAGFALVLFGWWSYGHWWGPSWGIFSGTKYNFSPERLFFPLLVFWSESTNVIAPRKIFSADRVLQLLSPITQVLPLPLKTREYQEAPAKKLNRVRLQGLVDIFVALIAVGIYCFIDRIVYVRATSQGVTGIIFLWVGLLYYILLFLKSFWMFRMITAIGRTLGLDLKDGFNFALLAVNPADRWRRWSIYYNEWLRDNFFFPIMVRTNKIFIPLFVTFMVSFVLHSFELFAYLGFQDLETNRELLLRSKLVYYFAHCLVVYFTSLTLRFWPEGRRRSGWFGVVATMFLMSGVHLLVWLTK